MRWCAAMLVLVFGCSGSGEPVVPLDATVGDVEDASDEARLDAMMDRSDARDVTIDRARADAADVSVDRTVADAVTDVVINPGMCGPLVRMCLCDCDGNGPCQNACIAANEDCGVCVYIAATRCCPDESRLFDDCIDRNMCADDGCIRMRCGEEQRRFEGCFASAQMGAEACRREMQMCLGPDYPMVQCVRP